MPHSERAAALSLAYFLDTLGRPVRIPPGDISAAQVWGGTSRETALHLGLRPGELRRLAAFRHDFSTKRAEAEMSSRGVVFIARGETGYPELLKMIYDPPFGLFVLGGSVMDGTRKDIPRLPRIAIVGARSASRYGTDAAEMLAAGLSRAGVCVVSGMAHGIDAAAHRSSTGERGGSIAVLGGGVDVVYPAANRKLYRKLARSGAIISEYPPGSRPRPWRFPARNRIIAGISRGVVVVEGREGSGSLITADFCLDQGGEVYAVPGSIFSPLSEGPLMLIRQGATAVWHPRQILDSLGMDGPETDSGKGGTTSVTGSTGAAGSGAEGSGPDDHGLNDAEQAILGAMDGAPRSIDVLAGRAGIDSGSASKALISLELRGLARYEQGRGYSR